MEERPDVSAGLGVGRGPRARDGGWDGGVGDDFGRLRRGPNSKVVLFLVSWVGV